MGHVQSHSSAMRLFASQEATESVEERREDDVDSNVDSTELPREMPRHATVPICRVIVVDITPPPRTATAQ